MSRNARSIFDSDDELESLKGGDKKWSRVRDHVFATVPLVQRLTCDDDVGRVPFKTEQGY